MKQSALLVISFLSVFFLFTISLLYLNGGAYSYAVEEGHKSSLLSFSLPSLSLGREEKKTKETNSQKTPPAQTKPLIKKTPLKNPLETPASIISLPPPRPKSTPQAVLKEEKGASPEVLQTHGGTDCYLDGSPTGSAGFNTTAVCDGLHIECNTSPSCIGTGYCFYSGKRKKCDEFVSCLGVCKFGAFIWDPVTLDCGCSQ